MRRRQTLGGTFHGIRIPDYVADSAGVVFLGCPYGDLCLWDSPLGWWSVYTVAGTGPKVRFQWLPLRGSLGGFVRVLFFFFFSIVYIWPVWVRPPKVEMVSFFGRQQERDEEKRDGLGRVEWWWYGVRRYGHVHKTRLPPFLRNLICLLPSKR